MKYGGNTLTKSHRKPFTSGRKPDVGPRRSSVCELGNRAETMVSLGRACHIDGSFVKALIQMTSIAIFASGVAALGGFLYLSHWAEQPIAVATPQVVEVPRATPLAALADDLEGRGIVDNAVAFQLWVRLKRTYSSYQAGTYRFSGQMTPTAIQKRMMSGDTYEPIVLQYTIPEGFQLKKIIERLAAHRIGHVRELRTLAFDAGFLAELKVPSRNLEGFLYPATYSFTRIPSPQTAFKHMVKTFYKKLPKNYESRVKAMGLSLFEAVTFASLIEAETMYDDEKPLISEVIWRRLKKKAPLAIDATIIYGIADYKGDIKWKHLQDASNPYNTRIHKGLPPTPIGSPGRNSLEAILSPSNEGFYYYVLKPGSDRHHFSKTLREHNRHVKRLVKANRRRNKN